MVRRADPAQIFSPPVLVAVISMIAVRAGFAKHRAHEVETGYSITMSNRTINLLIISIGAVVGFSSVAIGDIALGPGSSSFPNHLIQHFLSMQGG